MGKVLRQTGLLAVALGAIFFTPVSVADAPLHFICYECRNIVEHPEDARNYALNRMFGRESSLSFDNTLFLLSDVHGNTIQVNINAEFILDPYDYRLLDQLFVEDLRIQVVLAYPNGDVFRYTYSRNLLDPNGAFPVPANLPVTAPLPDPSTASGDDPRDEWDFQDAYWADWEEAWGGWHCRPDYSHPNSTGVICQQG